MKTCSNCCRKIHKWASICPECLFAVYSTTEHKMRREELLFALDEKVEEINIRLDNIDSKIKELNSRTSGSKHIGMK